MSTTAAEIEPLRAQWLSRLSADLDSDEVPINPYRVIRDLMRTIDPASAIVTHDSGHPRGQMVRAWVAPLPHGYIGWGNSTQLGTGLGLAMGAKLAAPHKTVVNFMGDAAFGMSGIDFETAVRAKIPILTALVNNSLMGGHPRAMPVATDRYGASYLSGDYAGVARALGGYAERVETPDEIVPAITRAQEAMADGRPALLEFITKHMGSG